MAALLAPSELLNRVGIHVAEEVAAKRMAKGSFELIREAVLCGEVDRGRAAAVTGYGERQARIVLAGLVERGVLRSDGPKKPVRLSFPIAMVDRWFPALYPASTS